MKSGLRLCRVSKARSTLIPVREYHNKKQAFLSEELCIARGPQSLTTLSSSARVNPPGEYAATI